MYIKHNFSYVKTKVPNQVSFTWQVNKLKSFPLMIGYLTNDFILFCESFEHFLTVNKVRALDTKYFLALHAQIFVYARYELMLFSVYTWLIPTLPKKTNKSNVIHLQRLMARTRAIVNWFPNESQQEIFLTSNRFVSSAGFGALFGQRRDETRLFWLMMQRFQHHIYPSCRWHLLFVMEFLKNHSSCWNV